MTAWNYANVFEIAADNLPGSPALVHGARTVAWAEFDKRADGVARVLLDAGVEQQDKVAQYLYNGPEYLESVFAAFKAGLVPVNTNYRYADEELIYLWDNADAIAVVFHGAFTERIDGIRGRLPKIKTWLWVDDGTGPYPEWAIPYEEAATTESERLMPPWGRSDDDILLVYTGGTTGMPKGVMYRQDDLIRATVGGTNPSYRVDPDYDEVRKTLTSPGLRTIPACPLMHGTGLYLALLALSTGGSVVTLQSRTFDVEQLLEVIQDKKCQVVVIVGDVFAKPVVKALDANPGRWDLSSVSVIFSSGVMWSQETKEALLRHQPGMMLLDFFGSSEAIGVGQSLSTAGGSSGTAKFALGENARVITDDGNDVAPGSGEIGRVAVRGFTPIGYYKDPEKSAATFVRIDGQAYAIPGDYATVEADGSFTLLGRGSMCINTGGEKVFPEEVEEILKRHPSVHDSVVVGLPDESFGEAIVAVVEAYPDDDLDEDALITHVKGNLAPFKAPKKIVPIATIARAPNGKVDYKRMRAYAADHLGIELST